jgi:hypothetical protein
MNHIYFQLITISPSISHSSKENCQPSHKPHWVLTPLHDKQNYYGISSAAFVSHKPDYKEIDQAKDRAIKDLSYGLSVDIQSYYKEKLSSYNDDEIKHIEMLTHQFYQSQQQTNIQMSTMISAQQQLIKDVEKNSQNIQSDYFLGYINDDVAIPKSDLHVKIVPEKREGLFS